MSHALRIELPDDVYHSLLVQAQQAGQPAERLAADWLANTARNLPSDPLEPYIGALSGEVAGWADRHDEHLGAISAERLSNAPQES